LTGLEGFGTTVDRMKREGLKLVILLLVVGTLVASCQKKTEAAVGDSPSEPFPTGTSENPDQRIIMEPVGGNRDAAGRPAPPTSSAPARPSGVSRIKSGNEGLLIPFLGEAILPEEMEIGPLQDLWSETPEKTVSQVLNRFFTALSKGKIEEDTLYSEAKDSIKRSLAYYVQREYLPDRVRYGRITIKEDTARTNIRIFGKEGRTVGSVYLVNRDGKWVILDFQADLSALEVPYKRDTLFNPGEFSWIGR